MIEPAAGGQAAHQFAARGIDIRFVDILKIVLGPGVEGFGQIAVGRLEKRPVEKAAVSHQLPSKTGFCLAAKASKAR